jgi:hypothetical protein
MPDLENEPDDKLLWRVRNDAGPLGAAAQVVLTKRSLERSMQRLIDALDKSSDTLAGLTKWLIGFTIGLVLIGVITLGVSVAALVVTITD